MPAYHYVAINLTGQEQTGVIEADNEKSARQLLRNKSLIPVTMRPAQESKSSSSNSWFSRFGKRRRLSTKELALFTRQFATLLAAGLPVEESLAAVGEQTEKPHVKGLILSVRGTVLEGHAFASALREQPNAFSPLFCATVAAGEKSGHLDKVLLRLADYTEQQAAMRQKLQTALIYPAMIVLVAFGIVGFLLEYVVPKMVAVYAHIEQSLPFLTKMLIGLSHFVKAAGVYVLIIILVAIYFWRRALRSNVELREKTHRFILKLPLIGYAIKTANTARFSRTLSILSASGVPMLEAMTISSQLITNIPIRRAVEQAVSRVREGSPIHLALKQTTYFSPMSIHMVASGEASGQLETMLERVALNQENDITRLIDVSLALFEPAIILIMGVIVLFIVLAVLLPIFQLNQFTQ
jgi:general secretion pathway protein F